MNRSWSLFLALALPACSSQPGQSLGGSFAGVSGLTATSDGLFFLQSDDANGAETLVTLPLAGGSPTTLAPSSVGVTAFALDATSAYVIDAAGLEQVPQAGGALVMLSTLSELGGSPSSLTWAGGNLMWIDLDASQILVRQKQDPNTPLLPTAIPITLSQPCALAVDTTNVYWIDCGSQQLASLPLDGLFQAPMPNVLASNLGVDTSALPSLVAVGGALFWSEPDSGTIRTVGAAGGTPVTLASGQTPSQIATDGTAVYWLNGANAGDLPGSVASVPAAGGTPTEVLTPDQDRNGGYSTIAIDASYLYFDDNDDGSIRRLAR